MGYEDIRRLAAEQDAWAVRNGGVGAAQVRSGSRQVTPEGNPDVWGTISEVLHAVPNYFTGRDPRDANAAIRNTEDSLRAVGEGLIGPEELFGGLARVAGGEGGGWDYANLALSALPLDGVGRAVGRRVANSRLGRYLGENVFDYADDAASFAARPQAQSPFAVTPLALPAPAPRLALPPPAAPLPEWAAKPRGGPALRPQRPRWRNRPGSPGSPVWRRSARRTAHARWRT